MDFKKLVEYQNFMKKSILSENNIDRKIELLSIINQLTAGPRNIVQTEHILIEAGLQGFSEKEAAAMIEQLKKDNIIYESSPGFIKKR